MDSRILLLFVLSTLIGWVWLCQSEIKYFINRRFNKFTKERVETTKQPNYIVAGNERVKQSDLIYALDLKYDELINTLLDNANSLTLRYAGHALAIKIKNETFFLWISNKFYGYGSSLNLEINKTNMKELFSRKGLKLETIKRIYDIESELISQLPIIEPVDNYKIAMDMIKNR